MTKDEKIKAIRKACIKANPEIVVNKHAQLIHFDHTVSYFEECRPIRLADVLISISATNKKHPLLELWSIEVSISKDNNGIENCNWNLLKDSLSDQSEETINFIFELLK